MGSALGLLARDDLAAVLDDEGSGGDGFGGGEAPAAGGRSEEACRGVEALLEALVGAAEAGGTHLRRALRVRQNVQTPLNAPFPFPVSLALAYRHIFLFLLLVPKQHQEQLIEQLSHQNVPL